MSPTSTATKDVSLHTALYLRPAKINRLTQVKTLQVDLVYSSKCEILRKSGDSPTVQTHWTSLTGVERVKNKDGKEMASMMKSPKNTKQAKRTRHVGSLKNNYILYSEIFRSMAVKGKAVPLQAWTGPEGSRKLRFPDFVTTAQDEGRLSTLGTGRLYPQEILLVLISVRG